MALLALAAMLAGLSILTAGCKNPPENGTLSASRQVNPAKMSVAYDIQDGDPIFVVTYTDEMLPGGLKAQFASRILNATIRVTPDQAGVSVSPIKLPPINTTDNFGRVYIPIRSGGVLHLGGSYELIVVTTVDYTGSGKSEDIVRAHAQGNLQIARDGAVEGVDISRVPRDEHGA